MRRKIADLKAGKMPSATGVSMPTPPPTSNGAANGQEMRDPRKELERLKRENEALLQLKELEMENLRLKNAPQADLDKKQQEMTMLLQKKQERLESHDPFMSEEKSSQENSRQSHVALIQK